ncbi:riboflavin synthase subunit alpha [Candidatus Epulonipiscium fishelsonii]|nr:riboflavin synthase subunit alpha [Epulopiscium sp. SCG-C06WGA-EpuloA1]
MFTGIIEEIGTVKQIKKGVKSAELLIEAKKIFSDLKLGDSVVTNGVCLTVTKISGNLFSADVMNETIKRARLGDLRQGSSVNLERAMPSNGRFGGHIVSGHIDGVGKIISISKDDIAFWYKISASSEIMRYIIEKGSITIDGISLTVAKTERDNFSVSIIPHTLSQTILKDKKIGSIVNLENDIVGKYIEKFMTVQKGITKDFLTQNGF